MKRELRDFRFDGPESGRATRDTEGSSAGKGEGKEGSVAKFSSRASLRKELAVLEAENRRLRNRQRCEVADGLLLLVCALTPDGVIEFVSGPTGGTIVWCTFPGEEGDGK